MIRQTRHFNFSMATDQGEFKLHLKTKLVSYPACTKG